MVHLTALVTSPHLVYMKLFSDQASKRNFKQDTMLFSCWRYTCLLRGISDWFPACLNSFADSYVVCV